MISYPWMALPYRLIYLTGSI